MSAAETNTLGFGALARRYASKLGGDENLINLIRGACTEAVQPAISEERTKILQFLRNESIIRFEKFPEQSRVLAWAANEIQAGKHLKG